MNTLNSRLTAFFGVRVRSLLLWLLFWTSLLPPLVRAEQFGDFTYTSDGAAITITGYTGAGGAVTIPGEISGLPVRMIDIDAFAGHASLTGVAIPASVTSVGAYAFVNCPRLLNIDVAASNTDYRSVDGILFNKSLTVLVQYPGARAGGYVIPDSVATIDHYAFQGCAGLTSVNIPSSVASIGNLGFNGCKGLTSVTIPASVTSIGGGLFGNCSELLSIEVAAENPAYRSVNGVLFDKGLTTLIQYPVGKAGSYVIPAGVTSLGWDAFLGGAKLTGVTFPDTLATIGQGVFWQCTGLTSLSLTDSLTSIGWYAFLGCTGLTNVTIPDSVTSIGGHAFWNCTGLTSVIIGSGVTSIESEAFQYSSALSSVIFEGDAPATFGTNVFDNTAPNFTIYYYGGSTGFTSPWKGYSTVALETAPRFTVQPFSRLVASGSTTTLSAAASGSPVPTFQWHLGESGDTSHPISGATSATYTTPPLTATARYWVRASNARGSADSRTAIAAVGWELKTLGFNFHSGSYTVTAVPEYRHTAALDAAANLKTTLWKNISISGHLSLADGRGRGSAGGITVHTYASGQYAAGSESQATNGDASQRVFRIYLDDWDGGNGYFNGDGIGASVHIAGIRNFLEANDATDYRLTVFYNSEEGNNVFPPAQVRRGLPGPASASAIPSLPLLGSTSVTVLGNGLQPYPAAGSSANGSQGRRAWGELAGLTDSDITLCLPTISAGRRASVSGFALTVIVPPPSLAAPTITIQPRSQTAVVGSTKVLFVAATGYPAPSFQWFRGESGDVSQPIAGAASAAYTTPAFAEAARYWVRVTNAAGSRDSESALLTPDTPPADAYAQVIAADSPIAWWRLDEAEAGPGAIAAEVLGGNPGVILNQPAPGAPGIAGGKAFTFSGFDKKIDVPYSPNLNRTVFTVECWALVRGGSGTFRTPLSSRDDFPARGFGFYAADNNRWQFYTGTSNTAGVWDILEGPAVVTGRWTHLAATVAGNTKRFYVNGTLAGSSTTAFALNTARPLRIGGGANEDLGAYFFNGEVDEVAVYGTALSAQRIAAHYAAGVGNTLAVWRQHHFNTVSTTGQAADDADPDGDGLTNAQEFAANTNPRNAASTFQVSEAARTEAGYTVAFDAQPGRRYVLQRLVPEVDTDWQPVATLDPLAAAGSTSLTDTAPPAGTALYRVQASLP